MGKLVVCIVENGHSCTLDCNEYTLVEAVQKILESMCGVLFHDQLLLCMGMKLEPHQQLSAYKLPSDVREVFLFNKARMRSNSPHPEPEQFEIVDMPDPPLKSSSNNPHPLDDASDPALKALPSYERQFRYHFQYGDVIYSRTLAKFTTCERLLGEQKVQERAMGMARGNLDPLYKMIHQNYSEFMNCYLQIHRSHSKLLATFEREKEKLRSVKILPFLQTAHYKCLLDFVKEEHLQKSWEECSSLHKQLENKVSEFKLEFENLKSNAEEVLSDKASVLIKDMELSIMNQQGLVDEQKGIMQALSEDLNTVRKLVDDCLSYQMSPLLRPHDAVSALGPMYDTHDKSYLPKMQSCEHEISSLLDICRGKKNEMNTYVHIFMQKIAQLQLTIKDFPYKFSLLQEAVKYQNNEFGQLKVMRGIGPAYRSCLAEVVRRNAAKKIYLDRAGHLAEKLAIERDAEVRRREEFHKIHSVYIPQDILASLGLYDIPNPCNVHVAPFDCNLLDICLPDLEHFAPESLLGFSPKSEKHVTLRSSLSMSDDCSLIAEVGRTVKFPIKYDHQELLEGSELIEISGASKMEVENAKLKAELASKIALICSMSVDFDYDSLDDTKLDSLVKNVVDKTTEALHLKDEYAKHLLSMLKVKQMQCESYEKRIQEFEQSLSDQDMQGCQLSTDVDGPNFVVSTAKTDDSKSEMSGVGDGAFYPLDSGICVEHEKEAGICFEHEKEAGICVEHEKLHEALDDNMTDSSGAVNPQLDSSMLDLHCDEGHHCDKDKKTTLSPSSGTALMTSDMAVNMSRTPDVLSCDKRELELQNALAEKSSQLDNAETMIQELIAEVYKVGIELDINQKLLDESQMNCARLEKCLHAAQEEAQTHLCASKHRLSEYNALHVTTIKMRDLFERLRKCVSSVGVAAFSDSLCALAQTLAREDEDDITAELHEFILILASKVGLLSRQHAELLETSSKTEYASKQLNQANTEKISFNQLHVHEIAAFVLNSSGHYEAIARNCPHYYLSSESVALFSENLPACPSYIVGQVAHIERLIVTSPPLASDQAENLMDEVDTLTPKTETNRLTVNQGLASNPYGLPIGCEYFIVTAAKLPERGVHSPPS